MDNRNDGNCPLQRVYSTKTGCSKKAYKFFLKPSSQLLRFSCNNFMYFGQLTGTVWAGLAITAVIIYNLSVHSTYKEINNLFNLTKSLGTDRIGIKTDPYKNGSTEKRIDIIGSAEHRIDRKSDRRKKWILTWVTIIMFKNFSFFSLQCKLYSILKYSIFKCIVLSKVLSKLFILKLC